jgi:hypothetical protein
MACNQTIQFQLESLYADYKNKLDDILRKFDNRVVIYRHNNHLFVSISTQRDGEICVDDYIVVTTKDLQYVSP